MLEVRPFRGLRYNLERVGDLSTVICPPYDVISPQEQRLYYHKSPYNVIRLELGEELPSDSFKDNKYARAAAMLKEWLEEKVLIQEQCPAFYIFEQCFTYQNITRRRWGLTAAVRLEGWDTKRIRPHEAILKEPVEDRLKLLRACPINLSPTLGALPHKKKGLLSLLPQLVRGKLALRGTDHYGVTHNMWIVSQEESIREICELCAEGVLYIADGHHRYEAALAYQREQYVVGSRYSGKEPFNFVMVTLIDAGDPGVLLLPAHRLVRLTDPGRLMKLKEKLSNFFDIEELYPRSPTLDETLKDWLGIMEEQGKEGVVIGLYGLCGEHLYLLSIRGEALLQALPSGHTQSWKELDVNLLHWGILRNLLGMDNPSHEGECLGYTRDGLEAVNRVNSGEYQLAFLLNPVSTYSLLAIADAGERMPQKSTYFYPKPPAGLVMNPLWGEGL